MRLILHLAKKELSMDHKNAIGDLDQMEELVDSNRIQEMHKRKT